MTAPTPDDAWFCGAFQPVDRADLIPYRCTQPHGHIGDHKAVIDGTIVARWPRRWETT